MNKSAIEKMVEWLETRIRLCRGYKHSQDGHLKEVRRRYNDCLVIAKRLLAEEQAQKPTGQDPHGFGVISVEKRDKILKDLYRPFPSNDKSTAPAGLVDIIMEEVIAVAGKEAYPAGNKDVLDICHIRKAITNAVSRYHPSTQADIVGVGKELLKNGSECYCHADGYLGPQPCAYCLAKEIISKHEGDK